MHRSGPRRSRQSHSTHNNQSNQHQVQRDNVRWIVPITRDLSYSCSVGLVQSKPWNKFAISFEGLAEVINKLWFDIYLKKATSYDDDSSDGFELSISKSCFSYFIWQLVYARMVEIESFHQKLNASDDIQRYKNEIKYIKHIRIPVALKTYLSSIGDIKDETGAEFILDFPVWPNKEGHFGRVSKDTHYKYETMAAPFILANRIMQDLAYTKNGGASQWNLPEELVPTEPNAGLPTHNLLGWDLREKLNRRQTELIESAGITIDKFNSTIPRFMWNFHLIMRIKSELDCIGITKDDFKSNFMVGTQSQIPWVSGVDSESSHKYTSNELTLHNCCKLKERFLYEASAFCFRVRKDQIQSLDSYCCYDFNSYKEVPDDWRMTRNKVFDHGDVNIWNLSTSQNSVMRYNLHRDFLNITEQNNGSVDPMVQNSFSLDRFTVSFEGLPGIIDETYNLLSVIDKLIAVQVSRSVFSYYVWMHLFARVVETSTLLDIHSEYDFPVNIVKRCLILSPIAQYLSSVGNIESKLGINLNIHFPIWPNEDGHFGKVTKDSHYKYEAMAAPAVLAQRIMEDLAYTENTTGVRTWNLRNIAPDERNAGLPTKNLLGWGLKEKLTVDQKCLIESAGITNDDFKVNHKKFMFNRDLFLSVSNIFRRRSLENCVVNMNESNLGSSSQLLWQKRDEHEEEVFDRLTEYCERPLRQMSFCYQNNKIVTASLLCSFRVRKDAIGSLDSYCCYDFNGYEEVPGDWKSTRNTVFEYGNMVKWNDSKFRSNLTTKDPFRRNWVRRQMLGI